jgi:electron transport complex protein RnfG
VRSLKHFFEQSWLLVLASFVFGLLIAVTSATLSPRIEQNKVMKFNRLASALLPDAQSFEPIKEPIEVQAADGRTQPLTVYRAATGEKTIGWVFTATGSGFQDKIELVLAVNADFTKLAGYNVLFSNETPGFGDRIKGDYFRDQFKGAPASTLTLLKTGDPSVIDADIVAISGATVSSTAVVRIVNHYVEQVKTQLEQKGLIGNGSQS